VAARDIIVVGASAGGVDALIRLVRGLPAGLPASLFVVCHFPAGGRSVLPDILSRSGPLLAAHARDGEPFAPGHIYVAPPDRHLVLRPDGRTRLTREARENHCRPAVDPLFRSAARYYRERVVGVILTGALSDGTAGLMAVRAGGGVAVVQDPKDAVVAAMPQNATEIAGADHIVPVDRMAALLASLVRSPVSENPGSRPVDPIDPIERMPEVAEQTMAAQARNERPGEVSTYTCPECGGSLWQVDDKGLIRFRCHVGHAYNGESLLTEQTEALEAALWTAVRTFKEKSVLGRQMAASELAKGNAAAASRFREQAEQADRYGELIVRHVLHAAANGGPGPDAPAQDSTP
jgi:two-component system chemotaxis response regulator CheB